MARLSAAFDILTRGASQAASDIDHVGNSSEKTGRKVERTHGQLRLLASTFTSSSNQALGPLQEIADKFDVIGRAADGARTKAGGKLLGIGAAGVGAGSFLATLYSREQGAAQQLQASIEQTGHSYDDFGAQIEAAVKHGEHFGNQAATTLDVLNRLTLTTHDPAEAIKDLGVTIDVAAAKHIELKKAAELVGLVFNGSTRSGKQFGLQLENLTGATTGLAAAQKASKSANDAVASAQQSYNDKLAVYNQTVKPTLAQQQALFRSHQDVVKAQETAVTTSERLKTAQDKANASTDAGARNVAKLAAITKGQGEAAADTFAGHLRALGAQIEDTGGHFGKYGQDIDTFALGFLSIGAVLESGLFPKLASLVGKLATTSTAFTTLRDVEVTTSAEGAAAVEAGAVKAEAAMAAEGAAAEGLGGKLTGLLGFGARLGALAIPLTAVASALAQLDLYNKQKGDTAGNLALVDAAQTIEEAKAAAAALTAKAAALQNKHENSSFLDIGKEFLGFANDPLDAAYSAQDAAAKANEKVRELEAAANAIAHQQARDLNSDDPKIAARAAQAIAKARATADAAKKAAAKPPTADQSMAEWLKLMGLGDPANAKTSAAAAEAAKAAKQVVVDAATAMRDTMKAEFDNAKSVLNDVMGQAKQLRESIADSLKSAVQITDVFGSGPNLNANHAFGAGHDFDSVKRFFEDRLTKLKRFAAELSALVHKGLDPALVAQIAQAGLDNGGGRLADALSGSTKGQLGQINNLSGQVNSIADSAGKRVADVQFKEQIAVAKNQTVVLGKKLDQQTRLLEKLTHTKPSAADDPRAAAFLAGA